MKSVHNLMVKKRQNVTSIKVCLRSGLIRKEKIALEKKLVLEVSSKKLVVGTWI